MAHASPRLAPSAAREPRAEARLDDDRPEPSMSLFLGIGAALAVFLFACLLWALFHAEDL